MTTLNLVKPFTFLALLLLIPGCSEMLVKANVTSFHTIDANNIDGMKYAFFPIDNQAKDLEYWTYCNLIEKGMLPLGAIRVPQEEADYLIFLVYGVDSGKEKLVSSPIWGNTGVTSSRTMGSIRSTGSNTANFNATTTYNSGFGIIGSETYSTTEYGRGMRLFIHAKSDLEQQIPTPVYQAKVTSEGSTGNFSRIMPSLLDALFKDFPGENGKSRTVYTPLM